MKILSKIVDINSLILEDFIDDYNITEPRKLSSCYLVYIDNQKLISENCNSRWLELLVISSYIRNNCFKRNATVNKKRYSATHRNRFIWTNTTTTTLGDYIINRFEKVHFKKEFNIAEQILYLGYA